LSTTGAYVEIMVFGGDVVDLETGEDRELAYAEAGVDCVCCAGPSAKMGDDQQ